MTAERSGWLVAVAVAAVVAVVEAPIVLAGRTWTDRAYQTEVVPSRAAAGSAWAAGRLPEWWDGSGLGVPLAAEPSHGAMYPLLAIAGAGPDLAAMDLLIVVHAMLAAIGVAIWARRRGVDEISAVVAGAALAASGALHAALLAGGLGVAWLPWIGWAAEPVDDPLARRAKIRRACLVAALIGAAGLAGPPAALIDAVIVAIVVGRSRWAVIGAAAGVVACACAWLPAIVHRAGDVASAGVAMPSADQWLGVFAPAGDARFHLGAAWIALAIVGVVRARHRRPQLALAIGGVSIAAQLAAPAWTAIDPAVHVGGFAIVACVLGAMGLDRLAMGLDRRAAAVLGAAAVVIAAALAARHEGAVASIAALGGIAALALAWPRAGAPQLAAALLVVGPALLALRDATPMIARSSLADRPVLAPREGVRVFRNRTMDPDSGDPAQRARDDHATLAGDVAARFGAATAESPDPARRAIEDDVWRAAGLSGGKLFDRYGVEMAIVPSSVADAMRAPPLAARGRWVLVDAQAKRPRAYVAQRTRAAASAADEVIATFPGPDERGTPLDTVVIAGAPDEGEHATVIARCDRRGVSPEQAIVTCAHAPAGWAVINDAWAPGWEASLDGDDALVRRADALVRAVRIGAGDHTIVWRYRTPWLRLSLIASGLAWVHVAFFAWLSRRRRPAV